MERKGRKGRMELIGGRESVDAFLSKCKWSGDSAYNAIKGILERLDNVKSQKEAPMFIASVQRHITAIDPHSHLSTLYFNIRDLSLSS